MGVHRNRIRIDALSAIVTLVTLVGGVGVAAAGVHQPAARGAALIKLGATSKGKVLVDSAGIALYDFAPDGKNVSHCNAECRHWWPPLMTKGQPTAGAGVKASLLGQTAKHQVTYNGRPLYYYIGDHNPGDITGEDLDTDGGYWWLVNAKGNSVK